MCAGGARVHFDDVFKKLLHVNRSSHRRTLRNRNLGYWTMRTYENNVHGFTNSLVSTCNNRFFHIRFHPNLCFNLFSLPGQTDNSTFRLQLLSPLNVDCHIDLLFNSSIYDRPGFLLYILRLTIVQPSRNPTKIFPQNTIKPHHYKCTVSPALYLRSSFKIFKYNINEFTNILFERKKIHG